MTFFFLCCLISVGFVAADPRILQLNKYSSGGEFLVDGIETGAKLYVASNDDPASLRNITITTGSTSTTLDKLSDYYDDGTPKYLNISAGLMIKTVNPDITTNGLSGYMYVTTYQQAQDSTFAVYVITQRQTISRTGMKTTTVVLNTAVKTGSVTDIDRPMKSSYVTRIDHSSNTNLYFKWGVPASNWYDVTDNTFFENPVNFQDYDPVTNKMVTNPVFFDNVEPLQVGLDYWYFMSMGPINMQLENAYVSQHNYTMTAVNTTGLIVNNFLYKDHQVNFLQDPTRNRTVGTFISTFLTSPVSFLLDGGGGIVSQTYGGDGNVIGAMSRTWFPAERLLINTTSLLPGTFYCQYYGFSTNLLPITTGAPTTAAPSTVNRQTNTPMVTTTTVATTTKSAQSYFIFDLLILLIAAVWLR